MTELQMATICFDWKKTHAPFFRKHGHPRMTGIVSENFKTPIKSLAILFFKDTEILGANWNSNPAPSRLCTWRKAKSNRPNGTWRLFLNNGSYPPRQHVTRDRPCKAGSCLLGACFKLLLLHGFMLFRIHEKFSWWLLSTLFYNWVHA